MVSTSAYISSLTLIWTFFLSFLLASLIFLILTEFQNVKLKIGLPMIPAIILVPLLNMLFLFIFKSSFLFPSLLTANFMDLFIAALIPSFVLLVSGGLWFQLYVASIKGIDRLTTMPFYIFGKSLGLTPRRIVFRPLMLDVFFSTWLRCLPWLFCEIVVVEALFNVPGVGSLIWRAFLERNVALGSLALLIFISFYLCLSFVVKVIVIQVGRKFESYSF